MELLNFFDDLEELIKECPRVPLTKKILIEEEELLKFLDKVRNALPEEMRQAKWVVDEREKLLNNAKENANRLLEQADEEVNRRTEETEIVIKARDKAGRIIEDAQKTAQEIINGSKKYAIDNISKAETIVAQTLEQLKEGKNQLGSPARQAEVKTGEEPAEDNAK